jgi:penicillin-binding protein 1C
MLAVRDGPRTAEGERVVAVKTGTSNGRRDAWAIGWNGAWTVGVWLGNPDGRPAEALVGREAAVPLFRAVLRGLGAAPAAACGPGPSAGRPVSICVATGLRAGPRCPERRVAFAAPDAAPLRECDAHVEALVDLDTGEVRCPRCVAGHAVARRTVLLLEPDVREHLARTGIRVRAAVHAADCGSVARPPRIQAPLDGAAYAGALPLRSSGVVDWFVDGRPVGRGAALSCPAGPGEHVVLAVGDGGRTATVTVTVD